MLKKISIAIITIIAIIGIFGNSVNADEGKNHLEVVKESSEVKYLENEQGYITKKITQANGETGEVIVEINVVNKKETVEQEVHKETEIYLIIDESGSMDAKLNSGKTRRDTVRESSKALAKSILEKYKNVKIGIIKFGSRAQMTSELTNNIEQLNTAIDTYKGGDTDLYDALFLAKNSYSSSEVNKLAIILTDGEPNSASVSKDENGNSISVAEITKKELINLENSGVSIFTMMTEISSPANAEKVFGTQENPTVGKYYYISDANISDIIEKDIYNDIVKHIYVTPTIKDVKVVDYFPGDILENFDFSYVDKPNIGTATDKIDETTKTITWDIEKMEGDGEANLKYKLKLRDMDNPDIVEKNIATNEKIILTYKDQDNKEYTVTLPSSPIVKLTREKEPEPTQPTKTPTPTKVPESIDTKKDDTIAKKPIPQTGESITIISAISIITVIIAISIIQLKKNNYK